jgi:hypothetical protein
MNRGNEVRQFQLKDLSVVHYPTTERPQEDVFSGRAGSQSMSCFTFINQHGKSNPGDRVDMDVSTSHLFCSHQPPVHPMTLSLTAVFAISVKHHAACYLQPASDISVNDA